MPRPIYSCFFIILLSAVLCSCRQAPVPAATDTPSPTPASSPTPSITPTPSPTSTPFLPPEVQAWTAAYPDFNWQEQLNSTGLNIPPEQLADRVKIGQGDVLQIYNEAGTAIDYSYDTENKVWIEAAKVLQPDKYNMESFIVVNSEEELLEEFRLEEMFLLPFSTNTYWPGPDKVNMDYIGDATPLGNLSGFSKAPTRLGVNQIIWGDRLIFTEQVYNPADGTFSCLHFVIPSKYYEMVYPTYLDTPAQGEYLLPVYKFTDDPATITQTFKSLFNYLVEKGYYTSGSHDFPKIKSLVDHWLSEGKVPEELENLILLPKTNVYLPGK